MPKITETKWDLLVSDDELKEAAKPRLKENIEETIKNKDLDEYLNNGWSVKKTKKTVSDVFKPKMPYDAFEDEIWSIFYKMGFSTMNKTNKFAIVYNEETGLSKQIDVIAIDDEVCLMVECKFSEKFDSKRNLHYEINEVQAFYNKVCNVIRSKYGKLKFKYIFATKNIAVSEQDKNRMKDLNIIHFDNNTILYFKALVDHLGTAARFQLLGQLFAKTKIENLDLKIPAIKGRMGPHTYYSFVIQPEKLLKIAYVLHKTNANNDYNDLLPSYQRLIKKDRLNSVRDFINNKEGYFPNSLIISIDTKKELRFEQAPSTFNENKLMKVGLLYLPQIYQSAYIIDGQHRLYGYSDSKHTEDNSIPVVAFENLDKKEQLKLFMEINMNQKAVPKALKNILEIDIYYDSPDAKLAQSALLGKIAKTLGEDNNSPLKGRIVIGEDATTKRCNITIENIKLALSKTGFFNSNGKNSQKGILQKGSNDYTFDFVYPFLRNFFKNIETEVSEEWNRESNFYVQNNLIGGLIRLLGDMVKINYEINKDIVNNSEILLNSCLKFIGETSLILKNLTPEERSTISSYRGANAPVETYRFLEMKLYEFDDDFKNDEIISYYENSYKTYNEDAKPLLLKIRENLISIIKEKFNEENWMRVHLSESHENDLTNRKSRENIANERNGIDTRIDEWDILSFDDIHKMIDFSSNWSNYFKEIFQNWDFNFTKSNAIGIVSTLNTSMNKLKDGSKIKGNDYYAIKDFYDLMFK